jgi:Domain of unknown function (DUF1877)
MSMILALATARDATLERLLSDPPLVWRVIAPDNLEAYEEARRSAPQRSLLARLFGKRSSDAEGSGAPDLTLEDGEGLSTDLDKSWHGIHYLLTGTASGGVAPVNFLVAGGRPVGKLDVGYGAVEAR